MGNSTSQTATYAEKHVFQKELETLNAIVNSILTEKNIFKNSDYNFLSQDVCNKHYILMESELNKHLKVNLKGVGEALYIIPKDSERTYSARNINKGEICQKISHHYMKILYILCLVKYVYNIEHHGDYSISGIIMRNIRIVDNIMEINFCNVPQKDFSKSLKDAYKIDFSKLEGLKFMTDFFLTKPESFSYVKVLKSVLARGSKTAINKHICNYIENTKAPLEHIKNLEKMYMQRYSEKLVCGGKAEEAGKKLRLEDAAHAKYNLFMYVEKNNPVFSKEYCSEIHKLVIQLNTPGGKKVLEAYKQMKDNYNMHLQDIQKLISLLVAKDKRGAYSLKDIDKRTLDDIVVKIKDTIKTYYIQSLLDFQKLLDIGKNVPNINMM